MTLNLGHVHGSSVNLIAGVALHGLVDVLSPARVVLYASVLVPLEGRWLQAAFFVSSFVHIGADTRLVISLLIHISIAACFFAQRREVGTAVMTYYMWTVHMPLLVARAVLLHHYISAVLVTLVVACGAYSGAHLLRRLGLVVDDDGVCHVRTHVVLPSLAQRIVVCHVVADFVM